MQFQSHIPHRFSPYIQARQLNLLISIVLLILAGHTLVPGQIGNGSETPQSANTQNRSDHSMQGSVRVNPKTLALEFSVSLMSYPGRNGNSVTASLDYSSKVWRMDPGNRWWYPLFTGVRYVTDLHARFAERSAAGWTSGLSAPTIELERGFYDQDGKAFEFPLGDSAAMDSLWAGAAAGGDDLLAAGNFECVSYTHYYCPDCVTPDGTIGAHIFQCNAWEIGGGVPEPDVITGSSIPESVRLFHVPRAWLTMSDGSRHELRQGDEAVPCGTPDNICSPNTHGTYLSVDGTGLRLEVGPEGSVLFFPNGSRYLFPAQPNEEHLEYSATEFRDVNGNTIGFSKTGSPGDMTRSLTDTMGRVIADPIPRNSRAQTQASGTSVAQVPWFGGKEKGFELVWTRLKPPGCEESTDAACAGTGSEQGMALEDQSQKLFFESRYFCTGSATTDLAANPSDLADPSNEVLFAAVKQGVRPCTSFAPSASGGPLAPVRFNPVVLGEIRLPNGQSYRFNYNRFGEISKITYPTGVYEEFDHGPVEPFNGLGEAVFDQANRGVKERRIYDERGVLQQRWKYAVQFEFAPENESVYRITATVSKADEAGSNGKRTETLISAGTGERPFGFGSAATGSTREIRNYDEEGRLLGRKLFKWISRPPAQGGNPSADRDLRELASVEVTVIPGHSKGLAALRTSRYDESGSAVPSNFSHLNKIRSEQWSFAALDASLVSNAEMDDLLPLIALAANRTSLVNNRFRYDGEYLSAGISSLIESEQLLDPGDSERILGETKYEYDSPSEPLIDPGDPAGWADPGNIPRGNVTAISRLDNSAGTWLTERFGYDKFGNRRISRDATENPLRYGTVDYSADYAFAYPTSTSLPAPDPSGFLGAATRSGMEKEYDFATGLVVAVRDLLEPGEPGDDRVTGFEYSDPLLRVTAVIHPGGARSETEYQDTPGAIRIATKDQIDPGVWKTSDEFYDGFGRLTKTRDVEKEGTTVIDRKYDLHGRLVSKTEPYWERAGDSGVVRHVRDYDAAGRLVRMLNLLPDNSLRTVSASSYGVSAEPGFEGVFTEMRDGSGRMSRTVQDHLGRVIRADEPVPNGTVAGEAGHADEPAQPTYFVYGNLGALIEIRQGPQRRLFAYDSLQRLIRQKLPEQEPNPDLVLADPETGNSQWSEGLEYDPTGNLVRQVNANGVVTESIFDDNDRLVSRTYSDGTPALSFKYDLLPNGRGQLVESANSNSATRVLEIDRSGNVTAAEQVTFGNSYRSEMRYSLSGDLTSLTYPSGREVVQVRGSAGRLRRIEGNSRSGPFAFATGFVYSASGKTLAMRLGNSRWETAGYDTEGRLLSIGVGSSISYSQLWKAYYEYGEVSGAWEIDPGAANGSVAKVTVSSEDWPDALVQSFQYDAQGRLNSAMESFGGSVNWSEEYGYDRFGNRTTAIENKGKNVLVKSADVDPLTNRFAAGEGYSYDRNGNIVEDAEGRTFVYDAFGRQLEVRGAAGDLVARYAYDAEGRRIFSATESGSTIFVYAGDRLISEYSTVSPAEPRLRFVSLDHLGTTRLITDIEGGVLERRDFKPFGEEITGGTSGRSTESGFSNLISPNRHGFAGYQEDAESGLKYAGARMYDPGTARFTSVDPLTSSIQSGDPRSLNRYTYARNDPVNGVDPHGLATVDDWYVSDDGKIEVFRTEDPFDRFHVFDENRNIFVLVAQLDKNENGLVRFPDAGYGFDNYNPGERGGFDPVTGETAGVGDHYLQPIAAAALFGFTNQLKNDLGITLSLGDMSASNGSDPWDIKFRTPIWDGHHSGHGHNGKNTGTDIDFRYVDSGGASRRGNWAVDPGMFDQKKNEAIFELAGKWGFAKNFRGTRVPIGGTRSAAGHNDHGHLGFDLAGKRAALLDIDRRLPFLREQEWTIGCIVDSCW